MRTTLKDGLEYVTMNATKPTEQTQDSKSQNKPRQTQNLDMRYGKIGISAVAAAVRSKHQAKSLQPSAVASRYVYDCD